MTSFTESPVSFEVNDATIHGTLFVPETVLRRTLFAPAMGVPSTFYHSFARFLAGRGHAVMLFDYAGVGASEARPDGTLEDWAEDLRAALSILQGRFPDVPSSLVGHSVGGQLFGLISGAPVERALLLAAQSGYWGLWRGFFRLKMIFLWFFFCPILVPLFGKMPKWLLGGSDIPKGVAMQWARWGRDPDYVKAFARRRGTPDGFTTYEGALRCVAFGDDALAPLAAVTALHDFYERADKDLLRVAPSQSLPTIGHFGAFRSTSAALWPDFADYLESTDAARP